MISVTCLTDPKDFPWLCRELRRSDPQGKWFQDEHIMAAAESSLCFWANDFEGEIREPVGFVRVLTDRALVSTITDAFVVDARQGEGIGRKLMERVLVHPWIAPTGIILATIGAQEFYGKFGFKRYEGTVMLRARP